MSEFRAKKSVKETPFLAHVRKKNDGSIEPHYLEAHLKSVSKLAKKFSEKIGLPSLGEIIGLLHDIGKYAEAFQTYLKSAEGIIDPDNDDYVEAIRLKGKIDHSSAGAQFIWAAIQQQNSQQGSLRAMAAQIMSICVASHHSGLIDCLSPDGSDVFSKRMAKPREKTHINEVLNKMDEAIKRRADSLLSSRTIYDELEKRLMLLKEEPSDEILKFMIGFLVRFVFSALIDADRLDSANFGNPAAASKRYNGSYPEWMSLIENLEHHLESFPVQSRVDQIRSAISTACRDFAVQEKGLYQLTVPTGGGKTLASLRFALHHSHRHGMDRVIYVVPFTSIIDQNARVSRSVFESLEKTGKQIVLEYHSNLTPEHDTWQNKLLAENWDAPIIYTTAVQFLDALFSAGTRGARRLHQIANAVIIFDEIQTIPIRTVHLFNNAINFLVSQCGSTVVFCTATQPLLERVDARKGAARFSVNAEMMGKAEDIKQLFKDLCRVKVDDGRKAGGWTVGEVAEEASLGLGDAGSVLVIVNTKKQARELFQYCRSKMEHVYHLSTSMCAAHRMVVLDKIKTCLDPINPKPVVCISTQLIEAGVDVDFGFVIRYLAGLDSIAQAAGRCNRNGRRPSGRVLIANPANENLDNLSEIRTARDIAERVLDEFQKDPASLENDLIGPSAMTLYYTYYFFNRAHQMTYPVSPKDVDRNDSLLNLLSTNELSVNAYKRGKKSFPPLHLRQSFMSAARAFAALDIPTEGVIVPYGEEGERVIADLAAASPFEKKEKLLKKAQRYAVNMYPYEIRKMKEMGAIYEGWKGSDILCLDSRYYSNEFGASTEQVGLMKPLIL